MTKLSDGTHEVSHQPALEQLHHLILLVGLPASLTSGLAPLPPASRARLLLDPKVPQLEGIVLLVRAVRALLEVAARSVREIDASRCQEGRQTLLQLRVQILRARQRLALSAPGTTARRG